MINHQIFVKQPSNKYSEPKEDKDPDVWDPPTPKIEKKKSNWGGNKAPAPNNERARRNAYNAGGNQVHYGKPTRGNPLGAYANFEDKPVPNKPKDRDGGDGRRNYDKPWLVPEKP